MAEGQFKQNPDGSWSQLTELTGSFIPQKSIAQNVTILAGATWYSNNYYDCKMSNVGLSLNIDSTGRKGKLSVIFYDSLGITNQSNLSVTVQDFSTAAAKTASNRVPSTGMRVRPSVVNSDTVDWTFANLDLFHC